MSQEQLASLGKNFPTTVEVITTLRPRYSIIAKMLDCGLQDMIPEVEVISEEEAAAAALEDDKKGVLGAEDHLELKGAAPRNKLGLAV